jgi:hypothetical protein
MVVSSLGFVGFAAAFLSVVWGLSRLMTERNEHS